MLSGISFGEVALLDPLNKRSASIVCKEPCEFLRVERDEFDLLLRQFHQRELDAKLALFQERGYFQTWHERALRVVVRDTHRMAFRPQTVIAIGSRELGNLNRGPQAYIIAKGKAFIVRKLKVVLDTKTGRVALATVADRRATSSSLQLKSLWVSSAPLTRGDMVPYMPDSAALVSEGCEVLYVPQTSFLFRDNGVVLDEIYEQSYMLRSSDKELFRSYNQVQKWEWFCFKTQEEVTHERAPSMPRNHRSLGNLSFS